MRSGTCWSGLQVQLSVGSLEEVTHHISRKVESDSFEVPVDQAQELIAFMLLVLTHLGMIRDPNVNDIRGAGGFISLPDISKGRCAMKYSPCTMPG